MAHYEETPEVMVLANHPDPLLGDIGELELRTALAFDRAGGREHAGRITSSRDVTQVALGIEAGQLAVLALDTRNRILNLMERPYDDPEGDEVQEAIVSGLRAAILSGAMGVIFVRRVSSEDMSGSELFTGLSRDPLVQWLELRHERAEAELGIRVLDYLLVDDDGITASAIDTGRFGT